jgi:TldD protein
MKTLCEMALSAALKAGADWADVRVIHLETQDVQTRNGQLSALYEDIDIGVGIRVLVRGAWGFAALSGFDKSGIEHTAQHAVRIAKASASCNQGQVQWAKEPAYKDFWQTPVTIDPFKISVEEKLELLLQCDKILRKDERVRVVDGSLSAKREHQFYANTEGARIEQSLVRTGAGYTATAVEGTETQVRSYPMSHGGSYLGQGWEMVMAMDLPGNAERVREEVVQLLTAPQCPSGRKDIVLLPRQLVLQIHESVGHATELDRVLGYEANYAGTSFATTDKLNTFRFGSEIVNLVADGTVPGGLATAGYDDDGVRQGRWHIVQDGLLTGYMTNRELAHRIGEEKSRGCNRAEGWCNLPITRINNLSLMPGQSSYEDLISGIEDGIVMDANKCWSIDQQRLNFQFGCEIGWRIRDGKVAEIVKNPSYQSITPEFWGACDAIGDPSQWELVGVANCGKGQPAQTAEMSHGSSPARFRQIEVGI